MHEAVGELEKLRSRAITAATRFDEDAAQAVKSIMRTEDEAREPAIVRAENRLTLPFAQDVRAGAGEGEDVFIESAELEIQIDRGALARWANASTVTVIRAEGDSMEPTVRDGDLVAVDYSKREALDNQMFVARTDAGLVIKRLRGVEGGWQLDSDNKEYDSVLVESGMKSWDEWHGRARCERRTEMKGSSPMRCQMDQWVAAALVTAAVALSVAHAAPGDKVYVQPESAGVHAGPGAQHEVLTHLPKGFELIEFEQLGPGRHSVIGSDFNEVVYKISEEDGSWTRVGVPGGGEGWMRSGDIGPAAASASALPTYDMEAYCAEVAKMAGGSYSLEKSCRDMEAGAMATLEARSVEPKIMQYCDEVARFSGGSYSLLDSCISMEEQARNAMTNN